MIRSALMQNMLKFLLKKMLFATRKMAVLCNGWAYVKRGRTNWLSYSKIVFSKVESLIVLEGRYFMKRIVSFSLMLIILITSFLISGCLPPNYTKEKAKEIAKNHQQEALDWFAANMPEAKPDGDVDAYEMSINLLGAVKGKYKHNGKNYKFVYEYTNKKMYLGEGYKDTCKIVEESLLKDFGYSSQEAEVNIYGYQFPGKNENDAPRKQFEEDNKAVKEFYSYQEELRPADKTPAQFAKDILAADTKERFTCYLHLYRDYYPTLDRNKLLQYPNLGSVWCNAKLDIIKQPQGIYQKVYLKDKTQEGYYHIEKITDDLYGGYITVKGKNLPNDKLKVNFKDDKFITLEIPENSTPVLFSKKNLTLVHYFKNVKGEQIENVVDEMYRDSKAGIKGYHMYDTELFVKDDFSYGYKNMRVSLVKGVYNYKILGVFDLDYWRLKFFN